jgi:hypothetical protein
MVTPVIISLYLPQPDSIIPPTDKTFPVKENLPIKFISLIKALSIKNRKEVKKEENSY